MDTTHEANLKPNVRTMVEPIRQGREYLKGAELSLRQGGPPQTREILQLRAQ